MSIIKRVEFHTLVYNVNDVGPLTRRLYGGNLAALFDEWPTRKPGPLEETVSFEDMPFIGHISGVSMPANTNELHFHAVIDVAGREELAWLLERLQIEAQFQRIIPRQPMVLRDKLVVSTIVVALLVLLIAVLAGFVGVLYAIAQGIAWLTG